MNTTTYLKERQRYWALRHNVKLVGSQNERGDKLYTSALDENLFEPLSDEARAQFAAGDGNELGRNGTPGKMQALHSSSALGVNLFHYWQKRGQLAPLLGSVGLKAPAAQRVRFETKWPIDSAFTVAPNIDVVIDNGTAADRNLIAIECKFGEAYSGYGHQGLRPPYLKLPAQQWRDLPNVLKLAQSISPTDDKYPHLHPAQLIKHILGLQKAQGRQGFTLLYLWYDVPGEDGACHAREVEQFAGIAAADGVRFVALTYQELILRLAQRLGPEHRKYVDYLTERYF